MNRYMSETGELRLSLETLIGSSRILGHHLENRRRIRKCTDRGLLEKFQYGSSADIDELSGSNFVLAPLDILVERSERGNKFHLIELNGSGIGGLTNMPNSTVAEILEEFENASIEDPDHLPLILVGLSGKENDGDPRLNRLAYEKILYVEAIRNGLLKTHKNVAVTTMASVLESKKSIKQFTPTIIVGYLKEFLSALSCRDGKLYLRNRAVTLVINDRLALNICSKFEGQLNEASFKVINRCYHAGADKSVVYDFLNQYGLEQTRSTCFSTQVRFNLCHSFKSLKETVVHRVRDGEKIVIKPHGTGLGHGIDFFLDKHESQDSIEQKIVASLDETQRFYGISGGALPYTVCNYINTAVVEDLESKFQGRKFEIRIVVYKSKHQLKAFPTIAKISPVMFSPEHINKDMLINNITSSSTKTKKSGMGFMLPLCEKQTLDTLGISVDEMCSLSVECTQFVKYILSKTPLHAPFF